MGCVWSHGWAVPCHSWEVRAWAPQQAQPLPAERVTLLPDPPHAADQHVRRSIQFCERDTADVEVCALAAEVCKGRVLRA